MFDHKKFQLDLKSNKTGINIYMESIEDTIRRIQKKYKNRPSPLSMMQENVQTNINEFKEQIKPAQDIRSSLLAGFKPSNDTFR
jgi:predicted transcriptional regulator